MWWFRKHRLQMVGLALLGVFGCSCCLPSSSAPIRRSIAIRYIVGAPMLPRIVDTDGNWRAVRLRRQGRRDLQTLRMRPPRHEPDLELGLFVRAARLFSASSPATSISSARRRAGSSMSSAPISPGSTCSRTIHASRPLGVGFVGVLISFILGDDRRRRWLGGAFDNIVMRLIGSSARFHAAAGWRWRRSCRETGVPSPSISGTAILAPLAGPGSPGAQQLPATRHGISCWRRGCPAASMPASSEAPAALVHEPIHRRCLHRLS